MKTIIPFDFTTVVCDVNSLDTLSDFVMKFIHNNYGRLFRLFNGNKELLEAVVKATLTIAYEPAKGE